MSTTMTAPSAMPPTRVFARTYREAPVMWVMGARVRALVDSEQTGGRYSLTEVYVPPMTKGPPPHSHADCEELFHVLEGGIKAFVEGQWRILRAGDTAIMPRGELHTFDNPFLSPCRFLVHISPGGFEGFFREIGTPCDQGVNSIRQPDAEPPSLERVRELSIKYHMAIPGLTT